MLDVQAIRERFPALGRTVNGRVPVYLDGPGGTQVPRGVIDAIVDYLSRCNSNTGGPFTTSRESDVILTEAHRACADLLDAPSPDEIVFGQNMTSLTLHISRSVGRTWAAGDPVVVTRLDHDANVRPWALAARDAGAEVRYVGLRHDGSLDEDDLARKVQGAKLLALTCASNATGTMPDVPRLVRLAHDAGAMVYLDAVHYAPHGTIDVRGWGCDFLACSAYKFFGPHVGILWARHDLLGSLAAYKVKPAPDVPPGKWMTGTQNHEGIAGVLACVEYLASLGQGKHRRDRLVSAMSAIRDHETRLAGELLAGLSEIPGVRVHGTKTTEGRAPTVAITVDGRTAGEVAERLAAEEIYAWSGHFYAMELAETMGVLPAGGFVRLGLVHYNTSDEVRRTLDALRRIVSHPA